MRPLLEFGTCCKKYMYSEFAGKTTQVTSTISLINDDSTLVFFVDLGSHSWLRNASNNYYLFNNYYASIIIHFGTILFNSEERNASRTLNIDAFI